MLFGFMTCLVFSSILCLVLYILRIEYSYLSSSHSNLYHHHYNMNESQSVNNLNIMEKRDDIIIFAYVAIMVGIIFPNLNQIDWL